MFINTQMTFERKKRKKISHPWFRHCMFPGSKLLLGFGFNYSEHHTCPSGTVPVHYREAPALFPEHNDLSSWPDLQETPKLFGNLMRSAAWWEFMEKGVEEALWAVPPLKKSDFEGLEKNRAIT